MPSFNVSGPIAVTIDVPVGAVRISAADATAATVDVQASDPTREDDVKVAGQAHVDYLDGQLTVRTPKLRQWRSRTVGGSVEVTISVPAGSRIHGTGQVTDFRTDGPLGDCRIKTSMGRIEIERAGAVELKTGIGDVVVDHATGRAEVSSGAGDVRLRSLDTGGLVRNSNGDTWIGAAAGDLQVKAANGAIAVGSASAGVSAKSANGDVRVGEVVKGSVVLESSIGDLEVGIREGTSAWLDVSAKAGKVHNMLAAADGPEPSADTVEVSARTSVGSIVIRRP